MATLEEIRYKAYLALKKADKATTNLIDPKEVKEEDIKSPTSGRLYTEDKEGKIKLTSDEKVYAGSYGLDPVLIRLNELITNPAGKMNTMLINIATCIRNAMDKELTLEENLKKISYEINTAIETIAEMFTRSHITHPYIVLYLNNYIEEWPIDKLRPITPGKTMYFELIKSFHNVLQESRIQKIGKVTVHTVKLNKGINYGQQLENILRGITKTIPEATYTGYYCLLSHQPLDYHVLNRCNLGVVISSHTGALYDYKLIGGKVFSSERLPFNMTMHGLLGDKEQIKPGVSVKSRQLIKQKAYVDKWYLKSDAQIRNALKSIGITIE